MNISELKNIILTNIQYLNTYNLITNFCDSYFYHGLGQKLDPRFITTKFMEEIITKGNIYNYNTGLFYKDIYHLIKNSYNTKIKDETLLYLKNKIILESIKHKEEDNKLLYLKKSEKLINEYQNLETNILKITNEKKD